MHKPHIFTAIHFLDNGEPFISYSITYVAAFSSAGAEQILRDENPNGLNPAFAIYLTTDGSIADRADHNSPTNTVFVFPGDNMEPVSREDHARWVKVQTSPGRDDGRVYAATYRRIV